MDGLARKLDDALTPSEMFHNAVQEGSRTAMIQMQKEYAWGGLGALICAYPSSPESWSATAASAVSRVNAHDTMFSLPGPWRALPLQISTPLDADALFHNEKVFKSKYAQEFLTTLDTLTKFVTRDKPIPLDPDKIGVPEGMVPMSLEDTSIIPTRVAILGSGIIGVTTAWYLQSKGIQVDVYDRQPDVGLETSFANGGQISVSHAEPWAGPGVPWKALKWMRQADAPLLFKFKWDIHQWMWGLQFLMECNHNSWLKNTQNLIALGLYSRKALQDLRAELSLEYHQGTHGIIHVYTNDALFEDTKKHAVFMEQLGVDRSVLTPGEAVHKEPALRHIFSRMKGATYTQSDESGDAWLFTQQVAQHAIARGAKFHSNVRITHLEKRYAQIEKVHALDQFNNKIEIKADAYVVALGSYTPLLVRDLELHCPIYPAKGYSATYPILDASSIPNMSVTDEERKVVFTKLGDTLRVAGTAEFNGYNTELSWERCNALDVATKDWFPHSVDHKHVKYWTGLRPATPNNTPLIGRAMPYQNLYFNTGHGTLGWTHACGSALGLSEIIQGKNPDCQFSWMK